jgi:acyl-coenzyme A thioesterase PaaI-like protein
MATAARSDVPEQGVVTIEMKTSFMHPAVGPLTARGTLVQRTASLAFTQSTIFDARDRACASAMGTFKYMKRAPGATAVASKSSPSAPIPTD